MYMWDPFPLWKIYYRTLVVLLEYIYDDFKQPADKYVNSGNRN